MSFAGKRLFQSNQRHDKIHIAIKMYCVIRLKLAKEKLVVPINWIFGFQTDKFHNQGINPNVKYVVFYSNNENDEADFGLQLSRTKKNTPSKYEASLMRFFGKYSHFYLFVPNIFNKCTIICIVASREAANEFVEKRNRGANKRLRDENINWLNQRSIKLENNLQIKTAAINNILSNDVGTVNLSAENIVLPPVCNLTVNAIASALPLGEQPADLYCAAFLVAPSRNVVIKLSWIKDFNTAKSLNKGLKSTNRFIVYYSALVNDEPDFNKPVACDINEPALYVANLLKFFGEMDNSCLYKICITNQYSIYKFVFIFRN